MEYNYTAIDKDGQKVKGSIDAPTREEALKLLHQRNFRPIDIKQAAGNSKRRLIPSFGKKVKSKDLVIFTRQLATMVSAGVALNRSLATLESQAESPYFKKVINGIAKDVQAGNALGDSFAKYPKVFSAVYVNMVKAGEAGGILEDILKRLANQVEKEASMRKKIKSAMTYPAVILTITIIGFFGIMIFIIPKISKILKDLGGENATLPIYTRMMLSASDFTRKYFIVIFAAMILAAWLFKRFTSTSQGKYKFHQFLLKAPIAGTIISKVAIARFSRTFASLMTAGVGVLEALQVTGGAIGNKVIEKELSDAALEVKNGKQLSDALSSSKNFPPIVSQMLAVGEETGKVDEILVKVADFYEEEVSNTIDSLSSLIEPLMIIVLGAIVGLIAASVMGPIASLSKNIQQN